MNLTCPHCGLRAFSAWRKLALGPVGMTPCRRCGLQVSTAVPQALVSFLPCGLAVAVVLSGALRSVPALVLTGAVGWAVTTLLYVVWVPLVPRQVTRLEAVTAAREAAGHAPTGDR